MIDIKRLPLVKVEYVCITEGCSESKYFFESYYEANYRFTKFCYNCKCITWHDRILHKDDAGKTYKPSLSIK